MALHILINVGTSSSQHEYVIDSLGNDVKNERCIVYLLYGRPVGNNDPLLNATNLKKYAQSKGFETRVKQIDEPFNLEECKKEYEKIVSSIGLSEGDRIIVSVGGGTNPMILSLLLAAINYLPLNNTEFVYVEGQTNVSTRDQMKLHTLSILPIENIMKELKSYSYHKASYLSKMLPNKHEYNFIKKAIDGPLAWETFNYEDALSKFNEIREYAELLKEQGKYNNLPDVVIRLHTKFSKIKKELKILKSITNEPERLPESLDHYKIIDLMPCLIADMLLNASRRFIEGLYTDSIIRCYRALEMCIQMLLLLNNINPWCIRKDSLPDKIKDKFNDGDKLNLGQGIGILCLDNSEIMKYIQEIQRIRNNSILIHGFIMQNKDDAERILTLTISVISNLLSKKNININYIINDIVHGFSNEEVELLWKKMNQ